MSLPRALQRPRRLLALAAAVVLLAAVMRAPLVAFGPVVDAIGTQLNINATTLGLIGAVPVLAFGLLSLAASSLSRRFGLCAALAAASACVFAGLLLRSAWPSGTALLAGTLVLSAGIAVANVLLPVLIRRYFALRTGLMTGLYTAAMSISGGLATVAAVPLADTWGWQVSLGIWLLPALGALLLWPPLARRIGRDLPPKLGHDAATVRIWRTPLAWQVSLFMGLQSLVFYTFAAWLPSMLAAKGMGALQAGWVASLSQWMGFPTFLLLGWLLGKTDAHRLPASGMAALVVAGLLGLWFLPASSAAWSIAVATVGISGMFLMSLMFIGLRTANTADAARLSGMAQCTGYLVAAAGPLGAGWLFEHSGSWNAVYGLLSAALLLAAVCGWYAARPLVLGEQAAGL
ncbi:MAG: MFS transporter [Eikenella sp.]|nr:MFS transporter [Eikenella sp.]